MKHSITGRHLAIAAACLALAACASAPPPIRYAQLDSSAQLQPNTSDHSGRVPYAYSSNVDWQKYANAMVDPTVIYSGVDSQFEKMSDENKQELAQYMQAQFTDTLATRFHIVSHPETGTIRVKLTLTGAKPTKQFMGTMMKFDLAGGGYNMVQSIRGKEGAMSGTVSYAVEIYDATTGQLLNAYVAKQYPNAMNVKATFGALSASKTGIKKGAQDLLARLN
jgi:uncharacterized lipoprotein YmbA